MRKIETITCGVPQGSIIGPLLLNLADHFYSITEFGRVFVYLKCKCIGYGYIVVICQNQLIIFIHAHSTTIADYSSIYCLLQTLVFLAKIGILSIVSGSKNSNLDIF